MNIFKKIYRSIFITPPEDVIKYMEDINGYTLKQIRSSAKDGKASKARKDLILCLSLYSRLSAKDISKHVNRSVVYVYNVLQHKRSNL